MRPLRTAGRMPTSAVPSFSSVDGATCSLRSIACDRMSDFHGHTLALYLTCHRPPTFSIDCVSSFLSGCLNSTVSSNLALESATSRLCPVFIGSPSRPEKGFVEKLRPVSRSNHNEFRLFSMDLIGISTNVLLFGRSFYLSQKLRDYSIVYLFLAAWEA